MLPLWYCCLLCRGRTVGELIRISPPRFPFWVKNYPCEKVSQSRQRDLSCILRSITRPVKPPFSVSPLYTSFKARMSLGCHCWRFRFVSFSSECLWLLFLHLCLDWSVFENCVLSLCMTCICILDHVQYWVAYLCQHWTCLTLLGTHFSSHPLLWFHIRSVNEDLDQVFFCKCPSYKRCRSWYLRLQSQMFSRWATVRQKIVLIGPWGIYYEWAF